MNNLLKPLVIATALNLMASSALLAQTKLTKSEAKEQAAEACQVAAKKRYGEDSIKYMSKKAKWMDGMDGASIKMKIKSKRVTKYSCVLQADKVVKFYKA